ncbi:WD_REPEATS_REGION domain-containing protein [Serendipita sp. 396]|nr:WD_REPEATS_REGION domain-containing protein [Serendipita sp. 396]KAG8783288.1 WD_REPEATS_REGION domain-containing protein [Serendipita sp. 397]KAG8801294.1 WD_REPEATS_REGION domain-containing protein [Serendipita sp. 398]KAG8823063.1 WD_REPEATS_REGION domain-containing protein [Serendipita sp. 401]KAG8869576.1 WD_REPEATS_REGION domain-containing protein [Serendipita sp. 405]
MPPKRKHSTEMPPILKRGRYSNWFEDREHQGARSVASNANAWPSLSSYSYVSNHDDDVSQYSNVTPTFPQVPHRSDHLNFTSLNIMISEGIDLFSPLRATCDVLQAVIQTIVENAENQEWAGLMKMLNFHLATVENQLVKLDEDRKIDEPTLPFDPMVKEPLQSYASKLQDIYSLTKQPGTTHNSSIFGEKLQGFDDAFFKYTRALHLFIAKTVDQVREDLSQVDPTFLKNALIESSRRFEDINVYGVQHRECHPDTRIKTLAAIRQWADDDDDSMCQVFCLLDFAGSGKSTVSKHMDREWKRDRKLMAKFFFSRDTVETMSTKRFCPTVANAFASQDETFKATLKQFQSQENCDLLPFEEQFDGLIVEPLKTINRRAILIIDALDECDNKYDQRDRLLQAISNQLPASLFLRVFLTGRPERDIKQWATTTTGVRCTSFLQLEGNHDDVERYIKQRLRDWPSTLQAKIYRVVENAESVFIWARIACDLLCKTIAQEALLRSLEKEVTLDYLYTIALEQSVPEDKYSRQVAVMVLGMILALGRPLSIAQLAQLSPSPEAIEAVVGSLGSILLYKDRNDPIRLIHATFHEYLTSATKSGPWFVQLGLGHYFLSSGCIDLLAGAVKNEQVELSNINHNIFKRKELFPLDGKIKH